MVRKPGSKHSAPSSRVTARRNDWNSIRVLHQGPRPPAASRGRIHDRSPIRLPKHQKSLADRGPSIHDGDGAHGLSIVIARSEATKQSTLTSLRDGLLRSARNDGIKCNLAPLAGRGPRRSAAKYQGEGDHPRVRACLRLPLTRSQDARDLSPQAGRGEESAARADATRPLHR